MSTDAVSPAAVSERTVSAGRPDARGVRAGVETSDRLLDAALALTAELGWARVTMAALSARAGVSRQTVYNAWGSRTRLAEAMVGRELRGFLAAIEAGFDAHPERPRRGLAEAIRRVQWRARGHVLLRAIVTAGPGEAAELVPLLTTRADAVLAAATATVRRRLAAWPAATDAERDVAADLLVRTVLSHLLQPGPAPDRLPGALAAAVARLLGGGEGDGDGDSAGDRDPAAGRCDGTPDSPSFR